MPNIEWWETDLRRMFHGVWAASPHNEQRMTDAAIEAIKPIFAHHRKMIVKEIREALGRCLNAETAMLYHKKRVAQEGRPKKGASTLNEEVAITAYSQALAYILSLPCLKENE